MKRQEFLGVLGLGVLTAPMLIRKQEVHAAVKDNIKTSMLEAYPVGAIYISTVNKNPHDFFGGVWEVWGTGRVPVAVDSSDSDFKTVEKTGGEE